MASFGLDPSNTCGDDPSAATKDFTIETSSDGVNWTLALESSFTENDLHRLNLRTPTGGTTNVRYVRLRLLSPLSAEPGDSGVDFIDFSEIEVYGGSALTGTLTATPPASTVGDTVTFNAAFTDPDGDTINKYQWDFDGNGTVDRTTAGSSTTFAYPAAGTFHPTVTASDTRGVKGAAATTETVSPKGTPPPAKHKPKIGKLPKTGKHGKVKFKVTCQSPCKLVATETMSKALKRKLHLSSRTAAKLSRTLKARKSARTITAHRVQEGPQGGQGPPRQDPEAQALGLGEDDGPEGSQEVPHRQGAALARPADRGPGEPPGPHRCQSRPPVAETHLSSIYVGRRETSARQHASTARAS